MAGSNNRGINGDSVTVYGGVRSYDGSEPWGKTRGPFTYADGTAGTGPPPAPQAPPTWPFKGSDLSNDPE